MTQKQYAMKQRVALYARVSYDDRDTEGRNLRGQLDMGRDYATEQGWDVVAEIAEDDRGRSGAAFELDGLQRIVTLAENGRIDAVLTREIDRLSRTLDKQLAVEGLLRELGVEVRYILYDYPPTPEGELNKHIRAVIAQYERAKITERLYRGRLLKVRAVGAMFHGRPPYGYNEDDDGRAVINEAQAAVVRRIFRWYADGVSAHSICRRLQREGVVAPGPANPDANIPHNGAETRWPRTTLMRMLSSETYVGCWTYGRDDVPGDVPAIVDETLFEQVRQRMTANRQQAARNTQTDYLFQYRAGCGLCGEPIYSRRYRRDDARNTWRPIIHYYCRSRWLKWNAVDAGVEPRSCALPTFRADEVDRSVWEFLAGWVAAGEMPAVDIVAPDLAALQERIARLDGDLAEQERQLDKLLPLYYKDVYTVEQLAVEKARLETAQQVATEQRAELVKRLAALQQMGPNRIAERLAELEHDLRAVDDFATRRTLVEQLGVTLTLTSDEEHRHQAVVKIAGYPVGVLRIPSGQESRYGRDWERLI